MDATDKQWLEWFGAALLFFLTLGGQAWRYIRESTKDEQPKHVVLEQAEIADLSAVRKLSSTVDRLSDVVDEMKRDRHETWDNFSTQLSDVLEKQKEVLTILNRIDREDEIAREVDRRFREKMTNTKP